MAKDKNDRIITSRTGSLVAAEKKTKTNKVTWEFPLIKKNLIILAIGVGTIIIGYLLMATGITDQPAVESGKWNNVFAVSIGPILLVLGYCFIIPYGLWKFFGTTKTPE